MGYLGAKTQAMAAAYGRELDIVKRPRQWFWVPEEITDMAAYLQAKGIDTSGGFKVLPRRWVVERTLAWLSRYRRLSKDYEYLCNTSENMLFLAATRTLLKRLVKQEIVI